MKDFVGVLLLLVGVFATVALFAYLAFSMNYVWWAMLQIVLSTAIILFCIRYFRSRRIRK